MPGPIRSLLRGPMAGGVVVAVALGTGGCTPRLEWDVPVEAHGPSGALAGVEVAVGGRFVGVTDATGRVVVPMEGEPGLRVRIEARDPDPLGVRLVRPAAAEVVVPSFWAWFAGASLSGRSRLAATRLVLESLAPTAPVEEAGDARRDDDESSFVPGTRAKKEPLESTKTAEIDLVDDAVAERVSADGGTTAGSQGAGGEGTTKGARSSSADATVSSATESATPADAAGETFGAGSRGKDANANALPTSPSASGVPSTTSLAPGVGGADSSAMAGDAGVAGGTVGGAFEGTGHSHSGAGTPLSRIAPPQGPASLVVEVFANGKPVRGAEAYFVRRASGRIVRLGETDEKGVLESDHPPVLLGETLLVRHSCCVSLQRPLPAAAAAISTTGTTAGGPLVPVAPVAPPRKVRVDLAPGVSHDFVAVETAYGVPRAVEKISFGAGGRTLDVTGLTGLALVSGKNLPAGLTAIDVSAPDALPPRRAVAFDVKAVTEDRPFLVDVARSLPRAPAVGFVEMVKGDVMHAESHLQGEPLYRRARRDFLSRFIQEKVLRPLIFQEVKRLADAAGLELSRLARRGWDMGPLTGEIDFLAVLEPLPGGEGLGARVVDPSGAAVWRGVFPYDGRAPPEAAGRAAYEGVLRALPFEFAVVRNDPVTLSVGKDARGLAPGDAMVRVGSLSPAGRERGAAACEGVLARDGVSMAFGAECEPAVAVGDVFARKGTARVSRKDVTTPVP